MCDFKLPLAELFLSLEDLCPISNCLWSKLFETFIVFDDFNFIPLRCLKMTHHM